MKMPRLALLLAITAAMALPGCNSSSASGDGQPLFAQLFAAGRGILASRANRRQPRPALTRAALDTVGKPALEATIERDGRFAYLFIEATRHDDTPGAITVWRTEDHISIVLRAGELIATRGLGGDVLSSETGPAPGTGQEGGARAMVVRTGNLGTQRIALACTRSDLGPMPVEIVEITHPTRLVREQCEAAGGGRITNEYWVDSRAGITWQSRQWAGPSIGYVTLRRLIK